MKASQFSDAQKAFILKKGAERWTQQASASASPMCTRTSDTTSR